MALNNHIWTFSTIGGVKRVNLDSGDDLVYLRELDPKLWTALSCPVHDLEIDNKTLELVDADKDGQIRVPEVLEAVEWIISVINNPNDLLTQVNEFPLSALNTNTELGKTLYDSAKIILKNLGKDQATVLTVEDTSDTVKIFAGTKFNGDGIITEDTADGNEALIALLNEIIQYVGFATDRNGKKGITQENLQLFFDECQAYSDWYSGKEGAIKDIMPLADNAAAAYQNYLDIKPKVDDFFLRCRLAAYDSQSTEMLNLQSARVEAITNQNLAGCLDEIAGYPLAKVTPGGTLSLVTGINPAWQNKITDFYNLTAKNLLPGKEAISEDEWNKISDAFASYAKWMAEKKGATVEALGLARIQEILQGSLKEKLTSLLLQDKAVEHEADNIILVDKVVRYYRDLFTLLRNFVTFVDFYTPGSKAIFQAGTLYIDQRSCDLCIRVQDMGRQGSLASFSGIYLIYCDCVSKATNEKMTIVAGLTNGDVDDLMVGRNAIFYDRRGLDWDATIVKIIENPVSIRQAFFAPYRRLSRFIETQVNKAATAADEKNAAKMNKGVEDAPGKIDDKKEGTSAPAQPFDVGKFAGIFAAIGLAIGAIGTVLAGVIGGFLKLTWWKMPFAIIGILIVISGPSMILAYIKLRKRSLAPILDANGWAINAKVKINIHFGRMLTHLAVLPRGAKVNLNDPFTKKKRPFLPIAIVLLVLAAVVLYFLNKNGIIHIRLSK